MMAAPPPLPRPRNASIGLLAPGNIDLNNRPVYFGNDGTYGTEFSFSIGTPQGEVLIPSIFNGQKHSQQEAIDHFMQTGENMGTFSSPEAADAYAQQVHQRDQGFGSMPVPMPGRPAALNATAPPAATEGNPVTLDDIGAALKRAAAAGDTQAATKLAAAYKAMQQNQPPAGPAQSADVRALLQAQATMPHSQPPTPQQEVDAALEAYRVANHPEMTVAQFKQRAGDVGAPLNLPEIAQNDQLFGFGDELAGLAGGTVAALNGKDFGKNYDAAQRMQLARRDLGLEKGGVPAQVASVIGELTSLGAGAGATAAAPGVAKTFGQKALQFGKDTAESAGTGAALGGVQGFGTANGDLGDRLEGAKNGAEAGAVVGAAAPAAIRTITAPFVAAGRNAAINAAIKNAPSADDLSSAASQMFKTAKSSGVGVQPSKFTQTVADLIQSAKGRDIDPDLDGAAVTVYRRAAELAQEGAADPGALSLSRLHNLRQKAQDVVMDPSSKNRTKQFAQDIVDGLDKMVGSLKPSDLTGPTNLIGNGKSAANSLLDGISTWAKAKKVGLVETAIAKSQNYLGGAESGLRNQFRTILNGKNASLFNELEKDAMRKVVKGTLPVKALRAIGIFKGMGSTILGGGLGGFWGAAAGAAAGAGARAITEASTSAAANRAAKIVATPNIPVPPRLRLPALTPFPLVQDQWDERAPSN